MRTRDEVKQLLDMCLMSSGENDRLITECEMVLRWVMGEDCISGLINDVRNISSKVRESN